VLTELPPPAERSPALSRIRARLAEVGPEQLVDEVAPGLHYGPGVLDDVVLVTSPMATPIVVEVAEPDRTVIVHPPLGDAGATDAGARLRDLGRALGDGTRMRLLHLLRGGERTLTELCAALDTPRTTLLHHLALLRGAGLVDLSVTAGEPNVYRLRPEGFEELGQAARAFPLQ
jgi:DNA-binding transcriptional ArsR family regulator